jgi:hypothetical protein
MWAGEFRRGRGGEPSRRRASDSRSIGDDLRSNRHAVAAFDAAPRSTHEREYRGAGAKREMKFEERDDVLGN